MDVSVVVVCYNHASYIMECLDSIFFQSYQNFEVIFIDAGSSDDSVTIVKESPYAERITIIERKGATLADNLNFGLSISKGDIFSPCAADDYWTLDKLERQVATFKKYSDLFAVSGNIIQVDEQSIPLELSKQNIIRNEKRLIFKDYFISQYFFPSIVCAYDIHKLRAIGGIPEGFGIEDFPLYLKASLANYEHRMIPQLLGFYRKSSGQYTSNQLRMVSEQSVILNQYRDHELYNIAKFNWGLDGAVRLATFNKKESIKLLINNFCLKAIFDYRFYKTLVKLIVR